MTDEEGGEGGAAAGSSSSSSRVVRVVATCVLLASALQISISEWAPLLAHVRRAEAAKEPRPKRTWEATQTAVAPHG